MTNPGCRGVKNWPRGGRATYHAVMVRLSLLFAGCITMATAGCARRDAPYRFRSPLLGAVAAADVVAPRAREKLPSEETARDFSPQDTSRDVSPTDITQHFSSRPRTSAPPPLSEDRPIRSEQPARALSGQGQSLAVWLRGLVGARDRNTTNVDLAIRCEVAMGARLDADLRAIHSGADLLAAANERDAFIASSEADALPLLGDLVVFDDVEPGERASLIGVVVSTDTRGTIEMIYLARGVVRRGFVTPEKPGLTRDASGRALNTFVRAGRPADPLDTEYLSSTLYAGYIRLDKL